LKLLPIICACLFLSASCTKKRLAPEDISLGLEYYPTTLGKYVIYDVDSCIYVQIPKDTFVYRYRIKEKLGEQFTDNLGQPTIKIERFIKKYNPSVPYDSMPWTPKEVWMVNATNRSIQVSERDLRYTKLIFPVQQYAKWNGNAFNSMGEWMYSYESIDKPEQINQLQLQDVLHVKQRDFYTQIAYLKHFEKYAKGIGLVYREIIDVYSNAVVSGVLTQDRIEYGLVYRQSIVSYGYE
jgi:hypothetical protein